MPLQFYIPDEIEVTFEESHSEFGLSFGGTSEFDLTIATLDEDSEAGDMPGLREGLFLCKVDGTSVASLGRQATLQTVAGGKRPMTLTFMEKPPKAIPATETEVEVELHCHVIVR